MNKSKWYSLFLSVAVVTMATGCGKQTTQATQVVKPTQTTQQTEEAEESNQTDQTMEEIHTILQTIEQVTEIHEVTAWQDEEYTTIQLAEGSQNITASGIYEVTGTLEEGMLTVKIDDEVDKGTVYLVLNNAQITSETQTPIYIESAKEVVILLESGTQNTIVQGNPDNVDEDFPSAAIYSKADLQIIGEGTLSVKTAFNDGITSKDDLVIAGTQIDVEAVGDGIVGKDLLAIKDANIQVKAEKDGLRATNSEEGKGNIVIEDGTYTIHAARDGIQAEQKLEIISGTFDIASGNGCTGVIKVNVQEQQADVGMMLPPPMQGMNGPGMVDRETSGQGEKPKLEGLVEGQGEKPKSEGLVEGQGEKPKLEGLPEGEGFEKPSKDKQAQQSKGQSQTAFISGEESIESMKALKAGTDIIIQDGDFNLSAYEDAIHADGNLTLKGGTYEIEAGDDGIHAGGTMEVASATIRIAQSYEGMEANEMLITSGDIHITSTDDAINVPDKAGTFTMHGGEIYLVPGNDGVDSNGHITITGGRIVVDTTGINVRNSAIDSEGTILFTGGTVEDHTGASIDPTEQHHPGGMGRR